MQVKGYNTEHQEFRRKAKETHQTCHQAKEAKNRSGVEPPICCFYNDLHAPVGRDLTSPLWTTVGTWRSPTQSPAVTSEEKEGRPAAGDSSHSMSQDLFETLP